MMERDSDARRRAEAHIKILEGEMLLIRDNVEKGIQGEEPGVVRAAVCRIRHHAKNVARSLGVKLPEDIANPEPHDTDKD
ncbi:MAG: hypothetical protein AAF989_08025 [Planctomycetota bacterium]